MGLILIEISDTPKDNTKDLAISLFVIGTGLILMALGFSYFKRKYKQ